VQSASQEGAAELLAATEYGDGIAVVASVILGELCITGFSMSDRTLFE
jgi:hypothetical protein